jgi:8-amino-7-oxononanoate synthase
VTRERLARLAEQNLYRQRRLVRPVDATHIEVDGRTYTNFASNNYLGLSHHPRVIAAAADAAAREGAGAGASPLVTGYGPAHASAERRIAAWKGAEAAVLLPSGYQANFAAVQALTAVGADVAGDNRGGVRFLLDKLAHASLIDAVRGSGAPFRVFPHNHLDKLERLLNEADPSQPQVVVTESIFSMDGDAADLAGLADLKRRHPFLLLLDEAHGSGVYGPAGAGLVAELGLGGTADVSVVTLSKALGCAGGAVCASAAFCELVVNSGRAYVYSTHIPAGIAASGEAAIDVLRDEPHRQQRVRQLARQVRRRLADAGLSVPAGDSPIIPVILGSEEAAMAAASGLQSDGLWAVPIRPPTVPRGGSRVRVTLSSEHTDDEIDRLLTSLIKLRPQ